MDPILISPKLVLIIIININDQSREEYQNFDDSTSSDDDSSFK
jgi:hypothetical protein